MRSARGTRSRAALAWLTCSSTSCFRVRRRSGETGTSSWSRAVLDAVTLDDARAFFRANYAPNNAVLAVVGDIDPEQTRRWAEKYFGSIPPHNAKVPPRDGTLPDVIGAERRVEIREEVPARALMA